MEEKEKYILDIQSVTKEYSSKKAVNQVSLQVKEGRILGLLGPNGAGKTSLIRMITGITRPDSGIILFQGKPLQESDQAHMGYMPEERGLYRKMKVLDQLIYLLSLKNLSSKQAQEVALEWLARFELSSWKGNMLGDLSKGMQQKIQFIVTVAHQPKLLILDEPFSGLDPLNSRIIEDTIVDLKNQGYTIIFSTHRMEQVEYFCDEIALINHGSIVLRDEVKSVRKKYRKNIFDYEWTTEGEFFIPEGVTVLKQTQHSIRVQIPDYEIKRKFTNQLVEQTDLIRFEEYLPSLAEIFIEVVQAK